MCNKSRKGGGAGCAKVIYHIYSTIPTIFDNQILNVTAVYSMNLGHALTDFRNDK